MLDRKTPPPFVQSTSFQLIQPKTHQLPNGVDVFFIAGGNQDVVKIELIFKAGKWYENTWCASQFTANLLTKGTTSKTSFQIAEIFDRYGAHVEIQPGNDFVSVEIYSLNQYLAPVLDLLMEILTVPSFPEKELEQHKAISIQNLKVNNEKTSVVASNIFKKNIFGESHPYGKIIEEKDIMALQRQHLLDHFSLFFKKAFILVSGKIDSTSERLIIDNFSSWATSESQPKIQEGIERKPFYDYTEKAESVQCTIRTGKKAIRRAHADYAFVVFVSHILGGYFGSRLMKNIREEKGLTYGIYSSLHPLQHDSYIVIGADIDKVNINLTRDEIRKELKTLRTEKISSDELDIARNHFIGSLQSEITTPFAHADKIKSIHLSGLPQHFYQDMITKIITLSPQQIIDTSEQYFNENDFFEVAVG
jgi:zinc protease